ncbi:phosphoglycolate phosphatase [Granulosicoccus sp. 3-233]|uniref:phosphoglycolate phosphatase n=1 Tax=Granulosicoccus sp. 3-233 TaxID=3417969 RepID=UPI003D32B908
MQGRRLPQRTRGRVPGTSAPLQLIAIDLDGTLVDSVKDLHQAVNRMQSGLSLPLASEAEVLGWVGNGIDRLVHRALTADMQADADAELFERASAAFRQAYGNMVGHYSRLYPGVLKGLDWMASLAVPLVVVTNKDSVFANALLQQLGIRHYFRHLVGGDDISAKKPDPEGLLVAARLCAAEPQHSLLIGDSISDFRAAAAAGFYCVGLSYGYNHGQAIDGLDAADAPDTVLDSFLELPALLT